MRAQNVITGLSYKIMWNKGLIKLSVGISKVQK